MVGGIETKGVGFHCHSVGFGVGHVSLSRFLLPSPTLLVLLLATAPGRSPYC